MDGICEVLPQAATDVTLQVGADVYVLGMLSCDDWSAITDQVRRMRPDPIETAHRMIAGLESREDRVVILEKAWADARRSQVVPEFEVRNWIATPDGTTFALWRSVRHHHPKISLETVRGWCQPMAEPGAGLGYVEICALIDKVHGMPPQGPT